LGLPALPGSLIWSRIVNRIAISAESQLSVPEARPCRRSTCWSTRSSRCS
jgi:hypothetical protein